MPSEHVDKPNLILRGLRKNGDARYETSVLLFEGKGAYLQGFVTVNGQQRHVLAHMNARKPDPTTGEAKPNYITLSEVTADGSLRQIGTGNALNRRGDGKPLYFDEVLLNVGDTVLSARVNPSVDPEMHRELGFTEPMKERPVNEAKSGYADSQAAEASPATPSDSASDNAPDASRSESNESPAKPSRSNKAVPEADTGATARASAASSSASTGESQREVAAPSKRRRSAPSLAN